jgi:hypothetical protein
VLLCSPLPQPASSLRGGQSGAPSGTVEIGFESAPMFVHCCHAAAAQLPEGAAIVVRRIMKPSRPLLTEPRGDLGVPQAKIARSLPLMREIGVARPWHAARRGMLSQPGHATAVLRRVDFAPASGTGAPGCADAWRSDGGSG